MKKRYMFYMISEIFDKKNYVNFFKQNKNKPSHFQTTYELYE